MPAAIISTDGANTAERAQEQRITRMLGALNQYIGALQPKTLSELRDVLEREVLAGRLDDATLKREVTEAHAALQQLDHYERLVLARYLQRQFSTELERWLFISSTSCAIPTSSLRRRLPRSTFAIAAEELRLRGMSGPGHAMCADTRDC